MWVLYSIVASILWGLTYTLAGKLLGRIGFSTLLAVEFLFGFLTMLGISLAAGTFKADFATLFFSKQNVLLSIPMIVAFTLGHVCIVLSIGNKNPTFASLIEMSYPLFIVGFSWFLFRETDMNMWTVLGGILIFIGVALIYLFNQ